MEPSVGEGCGRWLPRLSQVTVDDVTAVAQKYLDPDKLVTIVVGDLDKIEASLAGLGLGERQLLTPAL